MRTALLSFLMLAAVLTSGVGIYAATGNSSYQTADGYGISVRH
ncbi:hypothetical protein [Chelativorans composti]|jgi:hypothetical protein